MSQNNFTSNSLNSNEIKNNSNSNSNSNSDLNKNENKNENQNQNENNENENSQPKVYLENKIEMKQNNKFLEEMKEVSHESWKIQSRKKTKSAILNLCLNIGVDPPDVEKPDPCSILECWINPLSLNEQKALSAIGDTLEEQYKRWQSKIRYEQLLDPSVDNLKKACIQHQRLSQNERILFHFNGHGVPKPTKNRELWFFNQNYTQYIPVSIYEILTWLGNSAILVLDCAKADLLAPAFLSKENTILNSVNSEEEKDYILLAPCQKKQDLPTNPRFPADLFTSCLTTPIKTSLLWHTHSNIYSKTLLNNIHVEDLDKIPGRLMERHSPLGELNWIFTSITDMIAWSSFSNRLFKKLYREDLLVAAIFRNFLLAERIMKSMNCTPFSIPQLPSTDQHPLWKTWDLAVDICISQLPEFLSDSSYVFKSSTFFRDNVIGFENWLLSGTQAKYGVDLLPILLQLLLSQSYRKHALHLIAKFMDLGSWAVHKALTVGIFPYMLMLLSTHELEMKLILVSIWGKILLFDKSCQADIVKEKSYIHFIDLLASSEISHDHESAAAFVLSLILDHSHEAQIGCLNSNLLPICLSKLGEKSESRKWSCLCLSKLLEGFEEAKKQAVAAGISDKLFKLLKDPNPIIRACVIYGLSNTISENNDQESRNSEEFSISISLLGTANDGSPIVRRELLVFLSKLICLHEEKVQKVAMDIDEELSQFKTESIEDENSDHHSAIFSMWWNTLMQFSSDPYDEIKELADDFINKLRNHWKPIEYIDSEETENSTLKKQKQKQTRKGSLNKNHNSALGLLRNRSDKSLFAEAVDTKKHSKSFAFSNSPTKNKMATHKILKGIQDQTMEMESCPLNKNESDVSNLKPRGSSKNLQKESRSKISQETKETEKEEKMVPLQSTLFDLCVNSYSPPEDFQANNSVSISISMSFPISSQISESNNQHKAWRIREIEKTKRSMIQNVKESSIQKAKIQLNDQRAVIDNQTAKVTSVVFHPYESMLVCSDGEDEIFVWDWVENSGKLLHHFHNGNSGQSRISYLSLMNELTANPYVISGTTNGVVKIWKNCFIQNQNKNENENENENENYNHHEKNENQNENENENQNENQNQEILNQDINKSKEKPSLVTAWAMFPSFENKGNIADSNSVFDWNPNNGIVSGFGANRMIRLWNVETENQLQTLPTNSERGLSCLNHDPKNSNILFGGSYNGKLLVYDIRVKPAMSLVQCLTEHKNQIINFKKQFDSEEVLISGSVQGDVKFWDLRKPYALKTLTPYQGLMTALEIHDYCPLIACGSNNHSVKIFNTNGDLLNIIGYYDSFIVQKLGMVHAVSFHPYQIYLAATADSLISVFIPSYLKN